MAIDTMESSYLERDKGKLPLLGIPSMTPVFDYYTVATCMSACAVNFFGKGND